MKITTRKVISMSTGEILEHIQEEYVGSVDLCCGGASMAGEEGAASDTTDLFNQIKGQMGLEFGYASKAFNDLYSTMAPIVQLGPGQEGYTAPQLAAAKSLAITESGAAYENSRRTADARVAAAGGGTIALPSGYATATELATSLTSAEHQSAELLNIEQESRALGYNKWLAASKALAGAPEVFRASNELGGTAAQLALERFNQQKELYTQKQARNPWRMVGGALGGVAGFALGGPVGASIGSSLGGVIGGGVGGGSTSGSGFTPPAGSNWGGIFGGGGGTEGVTSSGVDWSDSSYMPGEAGEAGPA